MKQICILGPVDKRAITYPLIKVLDFTGKTLIITDDGVYRRFADNFEAEFTLGRIDFFVTPVVNMDEIIDYGYRLGTYDFVLFITTNELPDGCDKIIYSHGVDKSMCSQDVMTILEDIEYTDITLTPNAVMDKKVLKMDISKEVLAYAWLCEETKSFAVCKSSSIIKTVTNLFGEMLGINQDVVTKLLARKE